MCVAGRNWPFVSVTAPSVVQPYELASSKTVKPACVAHHVIAPSALVTVVHHEEAAVGTLHIQAKVAKLLMKLLMMPITVVTFVNHQPLSDVLTFNFWDRHAQNGFNVPHLTVLFLEQVLMLEKVASAQALSVIPEPRLATRIAEVMSTPTCHVIAPSTELHHHTTLATPPPAFLVSKFLQLLLYSRVFSAVFRLLASQAGMGGVLACEAQC
eukprot:732393-Amphidinium_carterae.1